MIPFMALARSISRRPRHVLALYQVALCWPCARQSLARRCCCRLACGTERTRRTANQTRRPTHRRPAARRVPRSLRSAVHGRPRVARCAGRALYQRDPRPRGDGNGARTRNALVRTVSEPHRHRAQRDRRAGPASAAAVRPQGGGASPYRFRGSSLFDWIRSAQISRALSVSRKDRGAILPLGRATERVLVRPGRTFHHQPLLRRHHSGVGAAVQRARHHRAVSHHMWEPLLPRRPMPSPIPNPLKRVARISCFRIE